MKDATIKMKVIGAKKYSVNSDKQGKKPAINGLKSSTVTSRINVKKEVLVPRASIQRYAELPSLRYGSTPTPTATQMLGSGPLRVSSTTVRSTKPSMSFSADGRNRNCCGVRSNFQNGGEEAHQTVRHVHFADLPPKSTRAEMGESKAGDGAESKARTRAATDVGGSVSSNPRSERRCPTSFPGSADVFRLGNNGAIQGGTVLSNRHASRGHDTARYRHGTLTQVTVPCQSSRLPPLLRAARDGSDDHLEDVLQKASNLGISGEDLNATDHSGRTALSYVASNGDIKTLEAILSLPGVDVNKPDNEGNTPLHFAAQAGQVEAIGCMLSAYTGLDIDARNSLGFTPLMKAALQGRTKCAKLLLCAGASPVMRDSGRGLRAEQWARYCGRYACAEVIEKFSRTKLLDRNGDHSRWGSQPELAARLLEGKLSLMHPLNSTSTSLKSRIRKAFRTTSHPGHDSSGKTFSVVSQLTSVALCASSPLLPSSQNVPSTVKSLVRPLAVPKVQVTLAATNADDRFSGFPSDQVSKRPEANAKKKH